MATIKAIEGRSVHQIQSGQVIVDLVSVVKELVENSLDAGATSIDVRFKNHGLDSIEVQDNGNGIAPEDYEGIALKHYTSKLSSFEDLDSLDTFGFRGEALSSLSALSALHIITARIQDGAVGKRLEFHQSGKLKDVSVVAAQKGTTVVVENLFYTLPVRRKELEKNIKREYGKVLSFLNSYACIGVGIRFSVSNQMPKGKKLTAFSTKGNATTKENIANIFGAKTLMALIKVNLKLNMQPGTGPTTQSAKAWSTQEADKSRVVLVEGHISKPGWGEGRQTPDRQMLFVNSRPCNLPQVSKVFNEVYKTFNHHQSPFILANFQMNTNSYDVNVSPDKKTIMLHDQTALLEALKAELTLLFENIDHTLPQTQLAAPKLPSYKPLSVPRRASSTSTDGSGENLIQDWVSRDSTQRRERLPTTAAKASSRVSGGTNADARPSLPPDFSGQPFEDRPNGHLVPAQEVSNNAVSDTEDHHHSHNHGSLPVGTPPTRVTPTSVKSTGSAHVVSNRVDEMEGTTDVTPDAMVAPGSQSSIPSVLTSTPRTMSGPVADAFARMRSRRVSSESAEIVIGDVPVTTPNTTLTTQPWSKRRKLNIIKRSNPNGTPDAPPSAMSSLTHFAAPGSQLLLNFGNQHGHTPDFAQDTHQQDDEGDSFANGDSTPEIMSDRHLHDDQETDSSLVDDEAPSVDHQSPDIPTDSPAEQLNPSESPLIQQEDETVARLIVEAEQSARQMASSKRGVLTTQPIISRKDVTYNVAARFTTSLDQIKQQMQKPWNEGQKNVGHGESIETPDQDLDPESKLSLTVHKADFERMKVVGQFNLGFILATRPGSTTYDPEQLFIIDQHAADEKYNYERLQSIVVLQSQRLVRPLELELSAVEKEVVLNHSDALKANGFEIDIAEDGESETTTQSFKLLTLPMTNHKTFQLSDLEELLHLLSELPSGSSEIPRPRKVQRMLAMRACRSSIMVGKTLTSTQMSNVVRHMGSMEKPWNCPHGRPTMRHLYGLGSWPDWHEHDEMNDEEHDHEINEANTWKQWLAQQA